MFCLNLGVFGDFTGLGLSPGTEIDFWGNCSVLRVGGLNFNLKNGIITGLN
jgi:hypothetical protein